MRLRTREFSSSLGLSGSAPPPTRPRRRLHMQLSSNERLWFHSRPISCQPAIYCRSLGMPVEECNRWGLGPRALLHFLWRSAWDIETHQSSNARYTLRLRAWPQHFFGSSIKICEFVSQHLDLQLLAIHLYSHRYRVTDLSTFEEFDGWTTALRGLSVREKFVVDLAYLFSHTKSDPRELNKLLYDLWLQDTLRKPEIEEQGWQSLSHPWYWSHCLLWSSQHRRCHVFARLRISRSSCTEYVVQEFMLWGRNPGNPLTNQGSLGGTPGVVQCFHAWSGFITVGQQQPYFTDLAAIP